MNNTGKGTEGPSSPSHQEDSFDLRQLFLQAILFIREPEVGWTRLREVEPSLREVYRSYFIPMLSLGPLLGGLLSVGQPRYIPQIVAEGIAQALFIALIFFFGAKMLVSVAPKFGTSFSEDRAWKWLAYGATPGYVGHALSHLPTVGPVFGLFGLYGLYVLYLGTDRYLKINPTRSIAFTIVAVVALGSMACVLGSLMQLVTR